MVLTLVLTTSPLWAVPGLINYQGKLTDPVGAVVPDGSYDMRFVIYDDVAPGGTLLWQEDQTIPVAGGIYNVQLGYGTVLPVDLFDNDALYLEVRVYNQATLSWETLEPRQQLTSTAFSMKTAKAEDADTLDGMDSLDFADTAHDHSFGEITGTATDAQIPNNITINNAATADYANTADSADYADSAGNADTVDGEHASAFADAVHAHGFSQITGTATDGQIPNDITINYAASAGNADTVDGLHASYFLSTSNDYGRSGVSSTLYEGSTALSNKYVGKSGSQTITSGNLTVNTSFGLGTANVTGVKGYAQSETNGSGVLGQATGSQGYGVYGSASGTDGRGVYGEATGRSGRGVYGLASGSLGRGVYGENSTSGTYGYIGSSSTGVYGVGSLQGVSGYSSGTGVYGAGNIGVHGYNTTSGNYGYLGSSLHGVRGTGIYGVYGDGSDVGVYGNGNSVGVWGTSSSGTGVYGMTSTGYAGYFLGDVRVTGFLEKIGGGFKIDHPLDPENKYLNHSFVESPDMKNIYDGVAVLDANGERWVELPEWFEALNKDFRYQLTPIGAPGPNLYIAQRITDNRFKIAGGSAEMEVSWQVTGIRQDPWAEANRKPVEEDKAPEEVGFYLSPESYGQPEEKGMEWGRNPEMMQRMKEMKELERPAEKDRPLEEES